MATRFPKAFVAGWLYLPVSHLANGGADLQSELTVRPHHFDKEKPPPKPIYLFDTVSHAGYMGVPIDWGVRRFKEVFDIDDHTVYGNDPGVLGKAVKRLPDPNHEKASAGQADFIQSLLDWGDQNYTVLAVAPTGSGKTVCACSVSAQIGHRTLALVHKTDLMDQWIERAQECLGLSRSDIGIVQGNKCEIDRPFVVGMMQSIYRRRDTYPAELWSAFGTVHWDEVHKVGAYTFAHTIGLFNAAFKYAWTATPKRKDGTQNTFLMQFGDNSQHVVSRQQAMPLLVHSFDYYARGEVWGKNHGAMMKCLSLDSRRNTWIVARIAEMHRKGRQVLVIGDAVAHLQKLMNMCRDKGIPENDMGQYTGSTYEGEGKPLKVTKEYLEWVKQYPSVIFATYGMMKEGTDIPRLDAGIDVTPRGDGAQVVGRIRRMMAGKKRPFWVTIRDVASPKLLGYYQARMKDLLGTGNVEVRDHGKANVG